MSTDTRKQASPTDVATHVPNDIDDEDLSNVKDMSDMLDSRCRYSTNLLSYYLTELNGLNLIIKIVLLAICLRIYLRKGGNPYIVAVLGLIALQVLVHIVIIVSSLPPFCDSSNYGWSEGKIFTRQYCHLKYEIYYSDTFWFLDNVLPNLLLVGIIYHSQKI